VKTKGRPDKEKPGQLARFKELAKKLEADASPHALERALARLDMKKGATRQAAKRKAKPANG
jgi:hypothetical protein